MAVAYKGVGTRSNASSGTSVTPALPTSRAPGDLLVAVVMTKNSATHTWPSGWTKITQQNTDGTFTASFGYCWVNGNEAAPAVTWTGSAGNGAQVYVIEDADPDGIIAWSINSSATANATHAGTALDGTLSGRIFYIDCGAANTAIGTPTNWTEHNDNGSGTGASRNAIGSIASYFGSAPGTASATGSNSVWVRFHFELHSRKAYRPRLSETDGNGVVTRGGLTFTGADASNIFQQRATFGSASKFYFELNNNYTNDTANLAVVLTTKTQTLSSATGSDPNLGLLFDCAGSSYSDNIPEYDDFSSTGIAVNGRICVAVDPVAGRAWAREDSGNWNNDSGADPASGTGGIDISSFGSEVWVAVQAYYNFGTLSLCFDSVSWKYTAPSGFSALGWPDDEFVYLATPTTSATAASGSLSISEPSGAAENDLMVCAVAYRDTATFSPPSGWTQVILENSGDTTAAGGIASLAVWWRLRGSSSAGGTWSRTGGDAAVGRMFAFRTTDPTIVEVDVYNSTTMGTASATGTLTGVTTTEDNTLVLAFGSTGQATNFASVDAATSPSAASSSANQFFGPQFEVWAEIADGATSLGADADLGVFMALKRNAGATGDLTFVNNTSSRMALGVIAFKFASATGSYTLTASAGSFAMTGVAANLKRDAKVAAGAGSFTLTGNAATLSRGFKVVAGSGSFSMTGIAAALRAGRRVSGQTGSFILTGINAGTLYGRRMTADAGDFDMVGHDAALRRGFSIVADVGSFALTGIDARTLYGRSLNAGAGAFNMTGVDARMLYGRRLGADAGDFDLTGQDAALRRGFGLQADAGSFLLTGVDASLRRNSRLAAAPGDFDMTGISAGMLYGRRLGADAGSFVITGQDALFVRGYTMSAGTGSFTLTGQDASLRRSYVLATEHGAFILNGVAADLLRDLRISAETGSFTLTGQAASLSYARAIRAEPGTFVLTGIDADLSAAVANRTLVAETGTFTITGNAATLARGYIVTAAPGDFDMTGNDAVLLANRRLVASPGDFMIASAGASLIYDGVSSITDAYTLSGPTIEEVVQTLTLSSTHGLHRKTSSVAGS